MKENSVSRALGLVFAGLTLAVPSAAQSDATVQSDIEFARQLASRFRYVDLAEEVILGLESRSLKKELKEELGLAKCDIYKQGAQREANPDKREELYDKAIAAYQEWMEDNPFSEFLPQAQRGYVDLANSYGRAMELALADAIGEEAEAKKQKISSVLEDALGLTSELITQLTPEAGEDPAPGQRNERFLVMLNRGRLLITLANVSDEPTFLFGQAEKTLEDLALEAGETSGWGMNAYLWLAKAKITQNKFDEATAFGEFVVNLAIPATEEEREEVEWDQIPAEMKERRWRFVEQGTADLVQAYTNAGSVRDACYWGLHFYNSWRREGFTMKPLGYLSLLSVGRALLASGGVVGGSTAQGTLQWFETEEERSAAGSFRANQRHNAIDLALSIGQTVNDENKGNTLEVMAKGLIAEISNLPGAVLSPDILLQAAEGEYFAQNYDRAHTALMGVLRSLESQDDATRQEYMPRVLYYIGASLNKLERPLEAAMAFREAATNWKFDPEYEERNAQGYYRRMGDVRRMMAGDKRINDMWLEAEQIVASVGSRDQGEILFRQADRSYGEKDYSAARDKFLKVPETANAYEKAKVKAALCLYKQKDFDAAKEEFRSYVEDFVPDPANTPNTGAKRGIREVALAQATFYLGRIAFDAQDYQEALKRLAGYSETFASQTDYVPVALYMTLSSYLGIQRIQEAKDAFAELREKFPNHKINGRAAGEIYTVLKQEEAAAESAGDAAKTAELKAQRAEFMGVRNAMTSKPNFQNLRTESSLWIDLGEWEKAEAALRKTLKNFDGVEAHKKSIESFVKPDLGLCLLEQKRVPEAFAILDPLIPHPDDKDDTRKPSSKTAANWCRSVCGWVEGDSRNIVEVPGVGGEDKFDAAAKTWIKLTTSAARDNKWDAPWYELKFQTAYCYYQWGKIDSKKTETCKNLIADLRSQLEDTTLRAIAEKSGDDLLQKRYLWLWDKVK